MLIEGPQGVGDGERTGDVSWLTNGAVVDIRIGTTSDENAYACGITKMRAVMGSCVLLENCSILIAEDEPLVALDLAMAVEDAHGTVIGPVASVAEALRLLNGEQVHAALLDVHLSDGDVDPVAALLTVIDVPFLFHCGLGLTPALKVRYPHVQVHLKPTPPGSLIGSLASLVAR